jgi:GTPase SAR1 family protein
MDPAELRRKYPNFRILVVGRADAGKTTLLQRVCQSTEQPEVFDEEGNQVHAALYNLITLTQLFSST